jgi:hypothetical protein
LPASASTSTLAELAVFASVSLPTDMCVVLAQTQPQDRKREVVSGAGGTPAERRR